MISLVNSCKILNCKHEQVEEVRSIVNLLYSDWKWKNCSTFLLNVFGMVFLAALAPRYVAPVAMLTLSFTIVSSGTA